MKTIFVSYRRTDSSEETLQIKKKLTEWFGNELVFRDEEAIPFGFDFRDVIKEALAESVAVLVVIGDRWSGALDDSGRRRLDLEDDPVRVEAELALKSKVPVIPVLVRGMQIPTAEELPESLRSLKYRHAVFLDPRSDDELGLARLREDLTVFVSASGVAGGAVRRDAVGRYIPDGVWFKERRSTWLLKARTEKQPVPFGRWATAPLLVLAILTFIVGACSSCYFMARAFRDAFTYKEYQYGDSRMKDGVLWDEGRREIRRPFWDPNSPFMNYEIILSGIPATYRKRIFYNYFNVVMFVACLAFTSVSLLALFFTRSGWNNHPLLLNLFGRTLIARKGDTIRVSDGVPWLVRSFKTKIATIVKTETREDCLGLVILRGGTLGIEESFDFGKRLSIKKKLFIVKALGKLLGAMAPVRREPASDSGIAR